ncbi:MAG: hypothetical protein ACSLE2_03440, partial [Lysobacterales bacterium]
KMNRLAKLLVLASTVFLYACDGAETGSADVAPTAIDSGPATGAMAAASKDPITALCVSYGDTQTLCECATDKFRANNRDADAYAAIATRFLADTEEGKSIADRWQGAVDVVLADYTSKSTELERMTDRLQLSNALGRAHREAIKSCGP